MAPLSAIGESHMIKGCLLAASAVLLAVIVCSFLIFVGIATDGEGVTRTFAAEPTPTIPAPVIDFTDEQIEQIADRVAERLSSGPSAAEITRILKASLDPVVKLLEEVLKQLAALVTARTTEQDSIDVEQSDVYLEIQMAVRCRQGPGMNYPTLNYLTLGDRVTILGRPELSGWWQVQHPSRVCWVFDGAGTVVGDILSLPVVAPPPVPTPKPEPEDDDRQANQACPEGVQESHPAVVDESWTPSGAWRVVNFWSNQVDPNFGDHKLLLEPGQNPGLLGGGSSWSWPDFCGDTARENYEANGLPPVSLGELKDLGLVNK
ncbi:hypothetical protein IH980_04165 [Patescibacteria group bacterium]|nr:hypothetical protein [Patescibacteria group bacterium]